MKILFVATDPRQTTGYARIGYVLSKYLASQNHEIVYFAFQNYDSTAISRDMHPRIRFVDVHTESKETFGYDIFADVMAREQPELLLMYNDMVVTCNLINLLLNKPRPCPVVAYLDLVYTYQCYDFVHHIDNYCDKIYVFSECWKTHLTEIGVCPAKLGVFPHGISDCFVPTDKIEARGRLGISPDDFLVVNTNRNSYRKALDITIKAFLLFWKAADCDPTIKLMINCRFDIADGYNMTDIIRYECLKLGLDSSRVANHQILRLNAAGGHVADSVINDLYNAADVGLNTCVGEGFGLCNLEGASVGVPQIVTKTGGLADIFAGFDNMLVKPVATMTLSRSIDAHSGDIDIVDPLDCAKKLMNYYTYDTLRKFDGDRIQAVVREKYRWPILLENFSRDLLTPVIPTVYWINLDNRHDRRDRMISQQLPFANARVQAIYDPITPHVGCMRSHHAALLNLKNSMAIICEDDVIFPDDFFQRLGELLTKMPMGWDVLQLHTQCPALTEWALSNKKQHIMKGYMMSCACYIVSRKGLKLFNQIFPTFPNITDKGRAEELVFRYLDSYTVTHSLVNTDETLGTSIPENDHKINVKNSNLLKKLRYPAEVSEIVYDLPVDLHHTEDSQFFSGLFKI